MDGSGEEVRPSAIAGTRPTLHDIDGRLAPVRLFWGQRQTQTSISKAGNPRSGILVAKIPCEIWINGSFVTEKPDPDDIDMSVMIEAEVIDILTDEQMSLINTTNTGVDHPDLEVYAFTRMKRSDPNYWNDFLNGARLMSEQYGMENSEAWLKGFAILRLRETNVGLRICS